MKTEESMGLIFHYLNRVPIDFFNMTPEKTKHDIA